MSETNTFGDAMERARHLLHASDARVLFHGHLDRCTRCRTQPFNLCPEGAALLATAATET